MRITVGKSAFLFSRFGRSVGLGGRIRWVCACFTVYSDTRSGPQNRPLRARGVDCGSHLSRWRVFSARLLPAPPENVFSRSDCGPDPSKRRIFPFRLRPGSIAGRAFSVRWRPGPLEVTCFLSPIAALTLEMTCVLRPIATRTPRSDVLSRSDYDPGPSK